MRSASLRRVLWLTSPPLFRLLLTFSQQRLAELGSAGVVEAYKVLNALLPAAYPVVAPAELATLLADAMDPATAAAAASSSSSDLCAIVANSLYTLDSILDERLASASAGSAAKAAAETARQAWTAFCRALWATGRLPPALLDRFDYPFLERVGLSRSPADILTRRNTRALTVKLCVLSCSS